MNYSKYDPMTHMIFIAELCQNHNGDLDTLLRMVDDAAEGGATHIKIQHIHPRNLVYRPQFEEGLSQDGIIRSIKRPWQMEYNRLKKLELSNTDYSRFVHHVQSTGLTPMTTCFARDNIDAIHENGFEEIKVASYDCASYHMLRELAAKFKSIYVSTGATFDDEVIHASRILKELNTNFHLLHCVTLYPTPLESMNLSRIPWLAQYCSRVGFSDHSLVSKYGVLASKAAIVCGAGIVERHFTSLNADETRDGPVSIRKQHLVDLVRFSRMTSEDQCTELSEEYANWSEMLGSPLRNLSAEELLNRDYYRGRFASPRIPKAHASTAMIMNWEETPL